MSCASEAEADAIMREAVSRRLAACGQTWPIRSCYRWEGEVVSDAEHALLLKSVDTNFGELCRLIMELHSYELPAIAMVADLETGPGYADWLHESVAGTDEPTHP